MAWSYETLHDGVRIGVEGDVVYKKKSPFQDLRIVNNKKFGNVLLLDGAIQTTQYDEFIYHEMLTHPLLLSHPNPKSVLVIGAGDGGVIREVLKHPKVKHVTLVEIDEEVIHLSKKYLPSICKKAFEDPRVRVLIEDGAKYIEATQDRYDLVMIDSPDPVGVAKVLFSKKFYKNVYSILNTKGMMIRQTGSTMLQPDELRDNYKVVNGIFSHASVQIAAIPTYIGGFFSFVIGSKSLDILGVSRSKLERKYNELNLDTQYYNPDIHVASLQLPNYIRRLIK